MGGIMKRAFTLIELLIVIAIIAILALIAVPNFLEAQVRAKVSRCHADMRSLATALEAYAVDWGTYTLGYRAYADFASSQGRNASMAEKRWNGFSRLTTPVAFMSTIPLDPFIDVASEAESGRTGLPYSWETIGHNQWGIDDVDRGWQAAKYGYTWIIFTRGPSRTYLGHQVRHLLQAMHEEGYSNAFWPYDATNGTMSLGYVVRHNKGSF